MEKLPHEVTLYYLSELTASDLISYCKTSKGAANHCSDTYFWQQKVRRSSRLELQNDWFLALARNGELLLLNYLCVAIEEEGWNIDEHATVLALVYLAETQSRRSRIERFLIQKAFPSTLSEEELQIMNTRYFGSGGRLMIISSNYILRPNLTQIG